MNLVYKENVSLSEIGEYSGKVTLLFNSGTRGGAYIYAHFVCNYTCKSRLTETGRAVKKNVIECLASSFCALYVYFKI